MRWTTWRATSVRPYNARVPDAGLAQARLRHEGDAPLAEARRRGVGRHPHAQAAPGRGLHSYSFQLNFSLLSTV